MDYSLHLYEDAVNATLHLTPMDGSPERYFTLTTTIAAYPPVKYYHTDHLGTPRALTDQNQQIVWQADYNPFGMANITTGQVTNNLRFPGQYFDVETGFHYNWNRYYDLETGRYISSDPIGLEGGLNTYSYVDNSPTVFIDPFGLCSCGFGNNNSHSHHHHGDGTRERNSDRQRRGHDGDTVSPARDGAWQKDGDIIPDSAVDDVDVPIPDIKEESKKDKCIEECYYHLEMSWFSSDIRTNNFNKCVNACMERESCE